jgi:ribosome-binding factor A
MTQRTDKIDALLREEIGAILTRDISDPAIGFTTVTDVETAPDLSRAQVWISQIGQPAERAASLAAITRALPYIRHLLGGRVRLRRIPELHVRVDETAVRGTRVLKLLAELNAADGTAGDVGVTASDPLPTPVPRLPAEGDAPADRLAPGDGPAPGGAAPVSRRPRSNRDRHRGRPGHRR